MVYATELGIKVSWDDKAVQVGMAHTQSDIRGFMSNVRSSISQGIGQALGQIGFTSVIDGVKALGKSMLDANAEWEDYNTQFEVMLGSASKAKSFLSDLQKMANVTPFETGDLAKASQTLLAFGTDAKKVMPIMQMIGDISMGNKEKFNGLTLAFAQMSSTGRLMGQDLLQMINQGFNPLTIISQKTGLSMGELKKKMEAGAITAEQVANAFKIATEQGGRFYGGMDKGSQTFNGLKSTLMDAIHVIMREIGEPFFKKAKEGLIKVIDYVSSDQGKAAIKNFISLAAKAALFAGSLFAFGKVFTFIKGLLPIFSSIGSALVTMAGESGALIGMSRGATMLAGAFGYVRTAIGLLTGPIGWIITAAVLIYEAWTHNFAGIRDFVMDTIGKIQKWIKDMQPVFEMVVKEIKRIWKEVWDFIGPYVQAVMKFIEEDISARLQIIAAGFELLLGALTIIFAMLSGDAEKAFSKMGSSAKFYAFQFMQVWETAITAIATLLAQLADSVSGWIGYIIPGAAEEMRKIRDYLNAIAEAHGVVAGVFKNLKEDAEKQMKAEAALEAQRLKALEAKKKAMKDLKGTGGTTDIGAFGDGNGKGKARKHGEELTREILLGMAKGIKTPSGEASCGYFASQMLRETGVQIGKSGNARDIVRALLKSGGYEVNAGSAKAGDLVYYRGKNYGAQKYNENGQRVGYHVGVYRGDGYVIDSSGGTNRMSRSLGRDAHFIRPSRTGKYANQDDVSKEAIDAYNKALSHQMDLQKEHKSAMQDLWREQLRLNGATASEIFQWEYKRGMYPEMTKQQYDQRLAAMQYNETLQKQNVVQEQIKQQREQMNSDIKQYIDGAKQEIATSALQTEQEKMLWEIREGRYKSATMWQKIFLTAAAESLDKDRKTKAGLEAYRDAIKKVDADIKQLGLSTKEAAIAQMMLKGMSRDQAEEVWGKEDRVKGLTSYKEHMKELANQMLELSMDTKEAAIQQMMLNESMTRAEAEEVFDKTKSVNGTKAYKDALKELNKEMLELTSTGREWQIQQLMIDEGMSRAQAEEIVKRKQQIEGLKEYRKQLEDAANGVTDIFMDSIGHLKNGFGDFFKNVVDGFRKMLQDMAMQYIRSQVYKFIFSFLENIGKKKGTGTPPINGGSGSSTPGGAISMLAGIGTTIANVFGSFGGFRANGGYMNARGIYVAGENGPEIIAPTDRSYVYNAKETASMLSSSSSASGHTVINLGGIVVHGVTDADSFKKNQRQIAADLYRMLEKAGRRNG